MVAATQRYPRTVTCTSDDSICRIGWASELNAWLCRETGFLKQTCKSSANAFYAMLEDYELQLRLKQWYMSPMEDAHLESDIEWRNQKYRWRNQLGGSNSLREENNRKGLLHQMNEASQHLNYGELSSILIRRAAELSFIAMRLTTTEQLPGIIASIWKFRRSRKWFVAVNGMSYIEPGTEPFTIQSGSMLFVYVWMIKSRLTLNHVRFCGCWAFSWSGQHYSRSM